MKTILLFCSALLVAGCSMFAPSEHAKELSTNRADDETCVARGLHYPSADYVSCRWSLQNERLRRRWRDAQMLGTAGKPAPTGAGADGFQPLDHTRFECHPEPQFGGDYVFCGEDEGPAKP